MKSVSIPRINAPEQAPPAHSFCAGFYSFCQAEQVKSAAQQVNAFPASKGTAEYAEYAEKGSLPRIPRIPRLSSLVFGCGSAVLGSLRLIRPAALRSTWRTSGLLAGLVQNLDLLAGDENSPAIGGQGRQLHRVQLLNSLHERFADPMPAIQHFSSRRENDRVTQIARVDVSGVFGDCSAGRKDVPWPAEPPDLVKAVQLTQPHSLDRESFCQLPELGLSCVGCCGGSFKDKEKIISDLKLNTLELAKYKKLRDFINRAPSNKLRESGICMNMTFIGCDKKNGNALVGCPAHPELNSMDDDREKHCDIQHLCKITQAFDFWDEGKRNAFFEFLQKRVDLGMDWFEYSIKMDNDDLLKEFEANYAKQIGERNQNRSILNKIGLIRN